MEKRHTKGILFILWIAVLGLIIWVPEIGTLVGVILLGVWILKRFGKFMDN